MRWVAGLIAVALTAAVAGCAITPGDAGVRIEFSTHGTVSLLPGETMRVEAKVIDVESGLPLLGRVIEASAIGGALDASSRRSPATFEFQVDRDSTSPFSVRLETESPSGGDSVTLRFDAGYRFDDVLVTAYMGDTGIEISEYWSGRVCGDPFREEWTFQQAVNETDVQNRYEHTMKPSLLDVRPVEFGGVPMIAANPDRRNGEPPFLLYLDYVVDKPFGPTSQRVELPIEPLGSDEC